MQDLYCYSNQLTYTDASKFIDFIINKLSGSEEKILMKVSDTYKKWKNEISQTLCHKYRENKYFTNAVAEGNNSKFGTLVKIAYGYRNFKRFRARIMLLLSYKN